jgi:hypothetical protein
MVFVITDLKTDFEIWAILVYVQLVVDKLSSGSTADSDRCFISVDTRGESAGGKGFQIQQESYFFLFFRPPPPHPVF